MDLIIPSKESIIQTSHEDIKQFYYSKWWPVRFMYRKRLQLALDALGHNHYEKMLELGTGGGFLLYSLTKYAREIVASDIHPNLAEVEKRLKTDGIHNVAFTTFDINAIPFKDEHFDVVISMSVLEHIKTLSNAVSEIKRVLKPEGVVIVGIPAETFLMTVGFNLIGAGEDVKHHHCNTHKEIIAELKTQFRSVEKKVFPLPSPFDMYYILQCRK